MTCPTWQLPARSEVERRRAYLGGLAVEAAILTIPLVGLAILWVRGLDAPPEAVAAGNWCALGAIVALALLTLRGGRR
jgi:hypothetical protein